MDGLPEARARRQSRQSTQELRADPTASQIGTCCDVPGSLLTGPSAACERNGPDC